MDFDFKWFKTLIEPELAGYKLSFDLLHSDADFINRVEILNGHLSVEIMFYNDGKLYIHLYGHKEEKELLNVFLEPHQKAEKEKAFNKLQELLQ